MPRCLPIPLLEPESRTQFAPHVERLSSGTAWAGTEQESFLLALEATQELLEAEGFVLKTLVDTTVRTFEAGARARELVEQGHRATLAMRSLALFLLAWVTGHYHQRVERMSKVAIVSVVLLVVGLGVGYLLGSMGNDSGGAPDEPLDEPGAAAATGSSGELVIIRRNAIEGEYPGLRDFENQQSFAGQSVKAQVDEGDYYFSYLVHGSGVPITEATCFRVDRVGRVFQVGVFPDPVDSYAGYRDVNPRNCRGIK